MARKSSKSPKSRHKKKGGGTDRREMARRLEIVRGLYTKAIPSWKIQAKCAEQFKCTDRAVRKYIARVEAQLAEERAALKLRPDVEFSRSLAMIDDLYLTAREGTEREVAMRVDGELRTVKVREKDLRTALHAAHRRAQLLGLYPSAKFELTGKDGLPISITTTVRNERAQLANLSTDEIRTLLRLVEKSTAASDVQPDGAAGGALPS